VGNGNGRLVLGLRCSLFQSFQPGDSTEKIWRKGNLHSTEMDLNWVTEAWWIMLS
jgi:hypothetical protein